MKKNIPFLTCFVLLFSFILLLTGCESLRRKFTRMKKKTQPQEEMIITPRDYDANPLPKDVLYKQYFVYWKSWNQELVTSLNDQAPLKKIKDCVEQAIANLKKMATYLSDEKAKELTVFTKETEALKVEIDQAASMPPSQLISLRYKAERILSSINRKFDLTKMRPYLKQKYL